MWLCNTQQHFEEGRAELILFYCRTLWKSKCMRDGKTGGSDPAGRDRHSPHLCGSGSEVRAPPIPQPPSHRHPAPAPAVGTGWGGRSGTFAWHLFVGRYFDFCVVWGFLSAGCNGTAAHHPARAIQRGTHTDRPTCLKFTQNVNSEQTHTSCLSNVAFPKELYLGGTF